MEDETEPNVYDQYEEYVKQVEVKQSNDISAEVGWQFHNCTETDRIS